MNELGGSSNRLLDGYQSPNISIPNNVPAPNNSLIKATPIKIKL